ncbi:MAG: hypothetical protein G01um101420_970 [Parcubacteria group bacterium Gr01-1014_20]|nr:MAG: hypothetical protein G01um101420_970 [Parcubacteria group bacterium Gr01-1014_20]
MSVLVAGDTLLVRSGTYAEGINLTAINGTVANPITIANYPGDARPIVRPFSSDLYNPLYIWSSNIIVDGFVYDAINIPYSAVTIDSGSTNVTVKNSEAKNGGANGVQINKDTENIKLINIDSHDNGRRAGLQPNVGVHGFYSSQEGSGLSIERSRVYNNRTRGIQIQCQNPCSATGRSNVTVRYNEIYSNGKGEFVGDTSHQVYTLGLAPGDNIVVNHNIIRDDAGGIENQYGTNVKIYNNTIYNMTRFTGIHIAAGDTIDIANNAIRSTTENGISTNYGVSWQPTNVTIRNNHVTLSDPWNPIDCFTNPSCTISNNTTTGDPLFVNPAAGNFNLQSGSPAINTGADLSGTGIPLINIDFAGVSRPQPPGGLWDIGAYEYVGAPPAINNLRLGASLEKDQRVDQKTFTVKILNPVTGMVLLERSLQPQAGLITLLSLNLEPGSYGVRISAPSHLARQLTQILTENLLITFPPLLAGDLNQDDIINSLDWSIMNPKWNTSDVISDLNGDSLTNSLDWSLMNKNWGG